MTRRELREHCFKLLFCADFYPEGETKEQMEEYFTEPVEEVSAPGGESEILHQTGCGRMKVKNGTSIRHSPSETANIRSSQYRVLFYPYRSLACRCSPPMRRNDSPNTTQPQMESSPERK